MADQPDVLKRLEEIEGRGLPLPSEDYYWLLRTIHALLESQGELIEAVRHARLQLRSDHPADVEREAYYVRKIARAEKVRKGEV